MMLTGRLSLPVSIIKKKTSLSTIAEREYIKPRNDAD
jgi:hypothetical protein